MKVFALKFKKGVFCIKKIFLKIYETLKNITVEFTVSIETLVTQL